MSMGRQSRSRLAAVYIRGLLPIHVERFSEPEALPCATIRNGFGRVPPSTMAGEHITLHKYGQGTQVQIWVGIHIVEIPGQS